MAGHVVTYTINLDGTAQNGVVKLTAEAKKATSAMDKLRNVATLYANVGVAVGAIKHAFDRVNASIAGAVRSYEAGAVATRQLGQAMRNTMGATDAQIQSIVDLTAAQQKLAVVGFSELEKMFAKIGETTIDVSADGVVINGGELGGLVKVQELKTQLEKATARIDGIIDAIKNAVPVAQDGGASLQTTMKTALALLTDKEDYGSIENEKVKQ